MQEFLSYLFVIWPNCLLTYIPLGMIAYWLAPQALVNRLPKITFRPTDQPKVKTPQEEADDYVQSLKTEEQAIADAQRDLDARRQRLEHAKATGLAVLKGGAA